MQTVELHTIFGHKFVRIQPPKERVFDRAAL
jgi:hypothetical protein